MTPTPLPSTPADLHARPRRPPPRSAPHAEPPRIAVVLGSGLNELADRLPDRDGHPLRRRFPTSRARPSPAMKARSSSASSAACPCSCSRDGSTTTRGTTWRP